MGARQGIFLPRHRVARLALVEQPVTAFHAFFGEFAVRRLVVRIGRIERRDALFDHRLQALQIGLDAGDQIEDRPYLDRAAVLLSCHGSPFFYRHRLRYIGRPPSQKRRRQALQLQ